MEGCFEEKRNLKSSGNYIMVDYTDFSGRVEMESVRLPDSTGSRIK